MNITAKQATSALLSKADESTSVPQGLYSSHRMAKYKKKEN